MIPQVQRTALMNGMVMSHPATSATLPPSTVLMHQEAAPSGKRKIHLRLVEELPEPKKVVPPKRVSFLRTLGRKSSHSMLGSSSALLKVEEDNANPAPPAGPQYREHGKVTVSWYEGTSSLELHEHVRSSVLRKLQLVSKNSTDKLSDLRVLDESSDPPEGTFCHDQNTHSKLCIHLTSLLLFLL